MEEQPHRYVSPAAQRYTPPSLRENDIPPQTPRRPLYTSDSHDLTTAVILLIAAVLGVNMSLYGGFHLGFTIGYGILFIVGAVYLRHVIRPRLYGLFCALAALAGSGVFIWHNDGEIRFFCYVGITVLTMLALVELTGVGKHNSGTLAAIRDFFSMWLARPFAYLHTAFSALFLTEKGTRRRFGGVMIGLLCAIPVLAILLPLLINADAAFEGLMRHTVLDHLGEMVISLLFGLALFSLVFSRAFSLRRGLNGSDTAAVSAERRGVDPLGVNTFLGIIGGLYVIYLFSQLAYFFSAFSGILPEKFNVAQYARRGFFEMCAVCAINLLIVAIALLISRRNEGKAPLSTRLLNLFILLFSLCLVAVALSKMVLYIGSFGMTRLRILTSVFMLMLATVLIFVGIRMFAIRFPYMRACVVTIALLGLVTAYTDVDTAVVKYNVEAYQSGKLEELDIDTITELSDCAVPYLLQLTDDKNTKIAARASEDLYYRLEKITEIDTNGKRIPQETDFRSFNIDSRRARELLLENAGPLEAVHKNAHRVNYSDDYEYYEDLREYNNDFAAYLENKFPDGNIEFTYLGYGSGEVYHAYDSSRYWENGCVWIFDYPLFIEHPGALDDIGIYIVSNGKVRTLQQFVDSGHSFEEIYYLLPIEMRDNGYTDSTTRETVKTHVSGTTC